MSDLRRSLAWKVPSWPLKQEKTKVRGSYEGRLSLVVVDFVVMVEHFRHGTFRFFRFGRKLVVSSRWIDGMELVERSSVSMVERLKDEFRILNFLT